MCVCMCVQVEEHLLDKFNHVAGIVPVLHGYIIHTVSVVYT